LHTFYPTTMTHEQIVCKMKSMRTTELSDYRSDLEGLIRQEWRKPEEVNLARRELRIAECELDERDLRNFMSGMFSIRCTD